MLLELLSQGVHLWPAPCELPCEPWEISKGFGKDFCCSRDSDQSEIGKPLISKYVQNMFKMDHNGSKWKMDENGSKRSSLCHESPVRLSTEHPRAATRRVLTMLSVLSPMFTMFTMVSLSEAVIEGGLVSLVKSCKVL